MNIAVVYVCLRVSRPMVMFIPVLRSYWSGLPPWKMTTHRQCAHAQMSILLCAPFAFATDIILVSDLSSFRLKSPTSVAWLRSDSVFFLPTRLYTLTLRRGRAVILCRARSPNTVVSVGGIEQVFLRFFFFFFNSKQCKGFTTVKQTKYYTYCESVTKNDKLGEYLSNLHRRAGGHIYFSGFCPSVDSTRRRSPFYRFLRLICRHLVSASGFFASNERFFTKKLDIFQSYAYHPYENGSEANYWQYTSLTVHNNNLLSPHTLYLFRNRLLGEPSRLWNKLDVFDSLQGFFFFFFFLIVSWEIPFFTVGKRRNFSSSPPHFYDFSSTVLLCKLG